MGKKLCTMWSHFLSEIKVYVKIRICCPVAQLVGVLSQKGCGFNAQSGHTPGLQV